jgi:FkbM family methyltransferase
LPAQWQHELKRLHFRRQIRRGEFLTWEPEYSMLSSLISPGDWVVDVGANVGHYTKRFAELVGPAGRVIAFEPVPETFALLVANLSTVPLSNITLINAAASEGTGLVSMSIPVFPTGLRNYYQAQISEASSGGDITTLTLAIGSLGFKHRIALVKIDAEGHEAGVLSGMHELLKNDHPILIVETDSAKLQESLRAIGYGVQRLERSPNLLFRYDG